MLGVYAGVAQAVEQWFCKPQVGSSILPHQLHLTRARDSGIIRVEDKEMTLNGTKYTQKRLDFIGTEIAEEINVKAVIFWLDDCVFIVEHDPMRRHHRSYRVKDE